MLQEETWAATHEAPHFCEVQKLPFNSILNLNFPMLTRSRSKVIQVNPLNPSTVPYNLCLNVGQCDVA